MGVPPANTILRKYTWGLDLGRTGVSPVIDSAGGIGGLLATEDVAETKDYYYVYDANGNVCQVLDASDGSIEARYEYDAYGNNLLDPTDPNQSGPYAADNPFRFSTKYWDDETGLGYWGYRYYSPRLGRWISRDPITEQGGLHLYGFLSNGPLDNIDPDGRAIVTVAVTTYMFGSAISNCIQACYCCWQWQKCHFRAAQQARTVLAQWEAAMDRCTDAECYARTLRKAKINMARAGFGAECKPLASCCRKKIVRAVLWVTGRYLAVKFILTSP